MNNHCGQFWQTGEQKRRHGLYQQQ
jgi:hypothetical protein